VDGQVDVTLSTLLGESMKNDRKFNPALFARLSDGDGLALIQR
jgi:hypothetical protein